MKKPKRIMPGSRIAIISPSSGLPYLFPDIYELGLRNLQEVMGFEIVEMPTARMSPDDLYGNPQLRAKDINDCFKDDQIDGIITSIGGDESIRILPFLDTELILNNPKFIMGFSDATTFLTYLNQLGMVTFYGPSIMAGLAQIKHLPSEHTEHLKSILLLNQFPYKYSPFEKWSNGYKDWGQLDTLGQCEEFSENDNGWSFLQGNSVEQGYLWGGCIEVLEFMKSTVYWANESFWHDKVLFFETSEEKPSPMQVGYMLRNYGMQGIFSKIKGIMFGRAKDYTPEENLMLNEIIVNVIKGEFGMDHLPIVVDFDFGHTDPKLILPLGGKVELNPNTNEITLLESPFTE
ncbi:LD-carboxypeptidase [Paenibacillus marchantiophytorum]|uniref:LD-carboxypeptidase n=1 Tax=Paenibacillus marchantiophytorum TaxID=1619310 RepID=A0ABQ1EYC2_9BACL|nr:S66 peptidase family protein [Paenibacillus marchantiophytorum]GFZ91903.1 LD-carboxypeptidase [Paenibacillus marchantiophytorum]